MTSYYDSHGYYKKMLELQEKLRKSEEERIRLEERFKVLLQESRNRHNTCINRLRFKYIEFLEEQRISDQRNYKLLEALDSVDNSLALMTARTDRLNILREQEHCSSVDTENRFRRMRNNTKHYEAYLRRMCTVHADDVNDVSVRKCDKYLRTDAKEQMNSPSPEPRSTLLLKSPRPNYQTSTFCSPSEAMKSKTTTYDPSTLQMYWKHDHQQLPKGYRVNRGYHQNQTHNNNNLSLDASDLQAESKLQSADRFDRLFTQGHLYLDATRFSDLPSIPQYPIDPSQRTQSLQPNPSSSYTNDNDSFPYLGRNEYDARCRNKQVRTEGNKEKDSTTMNDELDEYLDKIRKLHRDLDMQSSDEDGIRDDVRAATGSRDDSQLSAKESFDKNLTNNVKKVLELAENLVSRTMNASSGKHAEKEEDSLQSCASVAERNRVEVSDAQQGRATSMAHATDRISNDIALRRPELDPRENIEKPKNQSFQSLDDPSESQQDRSIRPSQNDDRIYVAEQSKLEQLLFSVSEALEPWNLHSVEKQIKQIDFLEETVPNESDAMQIEQEVRALETVQEQEQRAIFNDTNDRLESRDNEYSGDQHEVSKTEDQYGEVPAPPQLQVSGKENIASPNDNDKFVEQKDFNDYDDYKDNDQEKSDAMDNSLDAENSEKPSAKENLNEEYNYDQNESYEYQKKEDFQGYGIQEYPQEPSEQYEGYTSEQYDQYINHPESAYNNQPNAEYQEDTNEKYAYPYNEQYESNQEFTTNANEQYESNQEFTTNANEQYESNQEFATNANEQYESNQEFTTNANEQYESNQEFTTNANEQYESNQEFTTNANEQYESNQEFATNANEQYESNQEFTTNANEQYESNQEFTTNANEQYESNQELTTNANEQYEPNQTEVPQKPEHELETKLNVPGEESTEQPKESPSEEKEETQEKEKKEEKKQKEDSMETVSSKEDQSEILLSKNEQKKKKDVIKSLLDSDTDSTIEQNVTNTESDFDFN